MGDIDENGEDGEGDDEDGSDFSGTDRDGNDSYFDEAENKSLEEFDRKTQFTNYSMSSSVIRRNEQLKHLDEHFERLYSQYDDDQIGALDTEEIDGYRNTDLVLESAIKEIQKLTTKVDYKPEKIPLSKKPNLKTLKESNDDESEEREDDDEEEEEEETDEEYETIKYHIRNDDDKIDCESIISTYSNLYNRPNVIAEVNKARIRISAKTGLPIDEKAERIKKISKNQLEKLDHKIQRVLPPTLERAKSETKEEKKERKQAIKQHRRERRVEKKINKTAFKEEQNRQLNQIKSTNVNNNPDVTVIKLS